ncbi:hypothetical protein ES702_04930 [subsurface metagenome]
MRTEKEIIQEASRLSKGDDGELCSRWQLQALLWCLEEPDE